MMHDSVREELQPRAMPVVQRPVETRIEPPRPQLGRTFAMAAPKPVMQKRIETAGLVAPKTSPTLVGFQSKSTEVPDWRLQMQNAVQLRRGVQPAAENAAAPAPLVLTSRPAKQADPEPKLEITDQRVANAMRRIEESRRSALRGEAEPAKAPPMVARAARSLEIVPPTANRAAAAAPARVPSIKPRLVERTPLLEKRDTNKLPPIERVVPIEHLEELEAKTSIADEVVPMEFSLAERIHITADAAKAEPDIEIVEADEIEDLAPFSMRFGAGLFDLIIGAFAAMLVLSPVAFTSAEWFTTTGLVTFVAAVALLMFVYMTLCLGLAGKTMGMRLFSLELVDAVENEYPTLHQAAVSSAVFLLTLPFAGVGFLTVFFNEENRAAHDLLSGTILVRDF